MRASLLLALLVVAVVAVVAVAPRPAAAKSERTASYPMAKVWPTAVRFLRVDEGVTIVDKDAEAGYVVFEVVEGGKTFSGALELVATTDSQGRRSVRLYCQIQGRPEYSELGLLDRLLAKVSREHGEPGEAPAKEPDAPSKKPADKPAAKPAR